MSARRRSLVVLFGAALALVGVFRRHVRGAMGKDVPGGVLIGDVRLYDRLSHRLLLGSLFERIADDISADTPEGGRVLEVGCGPGHLSILLARRPGLEVTGLDLDPAMIERARANAFGETNRQGQKPAFLVGDVASLALPDGSFDLVVSTLSMHHWADPRAGFSEIGRVLRPGGRALVWDFRSRLAPLHLRIPDPAHHANGSSLRVVSVTPWRWPLGLALTQRIELAHPDLVPGRGGS